MIFITDVYSLLESPLTEQVDLALQYLKSIPNSLFALNLGGVKLISPASLRLLIDSLTKQPDLVFGNELETTMLAGTHDRRMALEGIFPNSLLVAETLGEDGVFIKFEGEIFSVSAQYVMPEKILDPTGAGDCFMGATMGVLSEKPVKNWNKTHIINAAKEGSYYASLVIQCNQPNIS